MVKAEPEVVKKEEKKEGKKDGKKDGKDVKGKDGKKGKDDKEKKDEMTEEDIKLQEDLNLILSRLEENDESLYEAGLESLRTIIRTSTTSVTSVPKPLKFMRPNYKRMKDIYEKITNESTKRLCADVVSALAMTVKGERDCLKFRLLGKQEEVGAWGQEYVKHVSDELGEEWKVITEDEKMSESEKAKKKAVLLELAKTVVDFYLKHNSEVEACDLMMEIGQYKMIADIADENTYPRLGLYLTSCVPYVPDPENTELLETAQKLYLRFDRQIEALRCAIMMNKMENIKSIFFDCKDRQMKEQMAILLGRHQIFLDIDPDLDNASTLTSLNSNSNLFNYFITLARELDIMEPKHPDDIYKTHLEPTTRSGFSASNQPDSAKANLANTFVNAFVNTGFCSEKLMGEDPTKWFYKNKEYGMLSAAASQGLIYRWDVDSGLGKCDAHLYASDDYIKAGSMLAIGIISSGIYHECDPAQALLLDYISSDKPLLRIGAIFGLGIAYANSKRDTVIDEVLPKLMAVLQEDNLSGDVLTVTALAIGLINVATGSSEACSAIYDVLLSKTQAQLKEKHFRFLALAIGLIQLGLQNEAEVWVESLKALPSPFGPMAATLTDVCAYAGTGNVLKIQELLHICSEHYEPVKEDKDGGKKKEEKKSESASATAAGAKKDEGKGTSATTAGEGSSSSSSATPAPASATTTTTPAKEETKEDLSLQQSVAVLGIGLIGMGEDVGSSMSSRIFGMLMRYGEPCIRQAVPLAISLISVSNPQLNILETLSKYTHDMDSAVTNNAIFSLGIVGAGTNNARLGNMLRQLAVYHKNDNQSLMLVRIAQGLTHMGKGTMSLSPYHSDRQLMCPASVAALFSTAFTFLDANNTVLSGKEHYLLYTLVPAIQPRLLLTFLEDDGQLEQVNVSVRVGQAVDVVGQAGRPKGITGFQTQTTPVLLAHGERAEMATEQYLSNSPVLEGIVILKKNPDYEEKKDDDKKKK